jgi:hypothetical protein
MKRQVGMDDELRPEYDLSELLKGGVKGKHADRFREGTNLVLLAPDVAAVFPDEQAVNEALRLVMRLARIPQADTQRVGER